MHWGIPLPSFFAKDSSLDHLSEAERKKILSKQRKAAKRAEAAAAPPSAKAPGKQEEDGKDNEKKVDSDPEGLQLAQTANPLDEALKFLRPLKVWHSLVAHGLQSCVCSGVTWECVFFFFLCLISFFFPSPYLRVHFPLPTTYRIISFLLSN